MLKLSITHSSSYSSGSTNYLKEVSVLESWHPVEKFDDIKFGKVLTKLYARMFSMEANKYLPPKYSFALKDLADFLGIFEVSEEDLKQ